MSEAARTARLKAEQQASNSAAYLELAKVTDALAAITVLTAIAFDVAFDTEEAKLDGQTFVFRVDVENFRAVQHGFDDVKERVLKIKDSF